MKVKNIKVLNDGLAAHVAEDIWAQTEANANYQFNKSHAAAYTIISVWTMWMRVRYPAEYFAASLSVVGEDKVESLVSDARECGIEILPPDINLSTDRFVIIDDKQLLAPFNSVKGISDNTARRIVELRDTAAELSYDAKGKPVWGDTVGRFATLEHFKITASQVGSKVNVRVVDSLDKVGALASIDPSSLPARHMDRRKDQMGLMPGLIADSVKADRTTDVKDPFVRSKIIHLVQEYKSCEGCDLAGLPHPSIRMKSNIKFMVVSDCPSWQEEKADRLMEGDAADFVKLAIKGAGLTASDGYYTTLVKAKKSEKFLTNAQINGCARFFERELELIKPPIIVALGSAAIKRLLPGLKGGTAAMAGKVIYDPALDASIVCGINAQQLIFDPSKASVLEDVFAKVAEMLN